MLGEDNHLLITDLLITKGIKLVKKKYYGNFNCNTNYMKYEWILMFDIWLHLRHFLELSIISDQDWYQSVAVQIWQNK